VRMTGGEIELEGSNAVQGSSANAPLNESHRYVDGTIYSMGVGMFLWKFATGER